MASIEDLYLNYVCHAILFFCTAFCVISLPGGIAPFILLNLQKDNHRWEKWSSYAFFQCLLVWNMLVTKICSMWRWLESPNHRHLCLFWQIFVYQSIQSTSSVFDLSNKGEIQTRQMKWNKGGGSLADRLQHLHHLLHAASQVSCRNHRHRHHNCHSHQCPDVIILLYYH